MRINPIDHTKRQNRQNRKEPSSILAFWLCDLWDKSARLRGMVTKLSHYSNTGGLYDEDYERNNIYTYHPDHLGSSNYITDPYGNEFEHIEYTPYGESWVEEGANLNIIGYKFTSKELDAETGLYFFGQRYLDPQTSKWMSCDPALSSYLPVKGVDNYKLPGMGGVFNPTNLNLYSYALNNPIIYKDSDGRAIPAAVVYGIYAYCTALATSPDTQRDLEMLAFDASQGDTVGVIEDMIGLVIPGLPSQATRGIAANGNHYFMGIMISILTQRMISFCIKKGIQVKNNNN